MTNNFWLKRNRHRFHNLHSEHKRQTLEASGVWLDWAEKLGRLYMRGLISKEKMKELLS